MDITFGAIPMVVLVYKGYRTVKEFVSSYKSFEEDSRSVKNKINLLEAIFTHTLDNLFKGVVEENIRRAMLQDPESEHWSKPELNERFEEKLGPQMPLVKGAIWNCEMILKKLEETQRSSQDRINVATDAATSAAGEPGSQQIGNHAFIGSTVICSRFRSNSKPYKRLVGCIRGIIAEMKALCTELNEEVTRLMVFSKVVQELRLERSAQARGGPSQSDDLVVDAAKACLVNAATGRLHPIVSNNLLCDCHLVHLCLDGQVPEVVKCATKSGKPSAIAESPTQFSFRLSASSDDAGSIVTPPPGPITVVFLSETTAAPSPASAEGTDSTKICEVFSSKIEGHERRFHGSQDGGGFRLRLHPSISGSRSCQPLSLHDVISHRLSDLTTLDRFLIAINLARSLIHLYSSPWVRDWGINTIYFFEGQEEANSCIGYWKPYLSLQRDNDNVSYLADKNRDIYRLGYLLLQLGCCSTKDIPAGQEDTFLMLCFERICRNMGPAYRNFVRECLQSWGANRNMNLLQDENLKVFLSHVTELQGAMAQLLNAS